MRSRRDESFKLHPWMVVGTGLLIVAVLALLSLFPEHILLIIGAATAVGGAGKLAVRHLGDHENDELPPASPAFRALADPSRPLTGDDPVSGTGVGGRAPKLPPGTG